MAGQAKSQIWLSSVCLPSSICSVYKFKVYAIENIKEHQAYKRTSKTLFTQYNTKHNKGHQAHKRTSKRYVHKITYSCHIQAILSFLTYKPLTLYRGKLMVDSLILWISVDRSTKTALILLIDDILLNVPKECVQ